MLQKLATLPILVFILVVGPLQAMAQQQPTPQPPQGYYGLGWHMWNDGYGWHFWWMFPLMMLFMFLVCGMIFLFARGSCGHGLHHWGPSHLMDRNDATHSAMQLLNERFARGEIQKEEYMDKKAAILSGARH